MEAMTLERDAAAQERPDATIKPHRVDAPAKTWLRALRLVAPAFKGGRPAQPIMSCVRIDVDCPEVRISGFDYLLAVSTVMTADEVEGGDGSFLVGHAWLTKTIRTLAKATDQDALVSVGVEPIMGEPMVTVSAGGYDVPVLVPKDVADYPVLPRVGDQGAVFGGEALRNAVEDVAVTVATDETLPVLEALHLVHEQGRGIRIEATDRYRMAFAQIEPTEGSLDGIDFLLRGGVWKALGPGLKEAETIRLDVTYGGSNNDEQWLTIDSGEITAVVVPTAGEYPKIKKLLEGRDERTELVYDRQDLLQVATTLNELDEPNPSKPVVLNVELGTLCAELHSDKYGRPPKAPPVVPLAVDGENTLSIAFNSHFLRDAVAAVRSDKIRISLTDPRQPARFSDGNATTRAPATYQHLVMPVRLPHTEATP